MYFNNKLQNQGGGGRNTLSIWNSSASFTLFIPNKNLSVLNFLGSHTIFDSVISPCTVKEVTGDHI